ncbi:MAG: NitT/TauT family transport system substrate-binding protein [Candidatus Binatota bacterium]|nr:NitT/TauT family transport system substrate-binding protein [Candidatus Binatota bacterium]
MLRPMILPAIFLTFLVSIEARAQTTAPDKVVVSYPSKSITNFPILETGQRRGFYQKENLSLSVVYMRGGIDIKALLTGDADFGTGSTTAVTAFVAGAPLRVVLSMNSFVDQALYAQPKYRSLAQLKGQSIGSLNPGGLVDTLLRKIIIQNGLSPERDFIILNMGGTPERYAALKSGTLSASMLSAPHSLRAEKDGFTRIAATRDYVDVPGTGLVVHADKIKKQPSMMKRFLRATLRAMAYIRENRVDTTQMIVREFGMDQEVAALAYKQLLELLSTDGKNRIDGYQLLIDFARAAQRIERPISSAQLIDETILDELIREGGISR